MEGFRAFRQLGKVPFQRLRDCIEEAPDVPPFKRIMTRLTPFMKD